MGMAATRVDERLLASLGLSPVEPVRFESCRSISGGGVMLLLPFLMEPGLYYVDGHVQVYHGHLAELGRKHVSRQRLCLPGMMEFWVNSASGIPYKIPLSRMPEQTRYNKLHQESKHLQNIVKMICYRAETAMANLLAPHFTRSRDEVRALVKSIISRQIDMHPDYDNGTLEITLYPLSNNRSNEAVSKILETLNRTQTKYPGTDLVLLYKTATI